MSHVNRLILRLTKAAAHGRSTAMILIILGPPGAPPGGGQPTTVAMVNLQPIQSTNRITWRTRTFLYCVLYHALAS